MLFSVCSCLVFQKTEQPLDPSLHIQLVYTRLAADTIKIKYTRSQMHLFVLKPTSKLTPSPLCLSLLLQRSQMELEMLSLSAW